MELTFSKIIRWFVGLLFVMVALGSLIGGHILAAVFCILIVMICIPAIADPIEKNMNLKMSGAIRFVLVFVLMLGMSAVTPNTTQDTKALADQATTNITTGAHNISLSVQENTPIETQNTSESASVPTTKDTQEDLETGTKTTQEVASASTATQALDNNGTLNIVTNPAGAMITIDGVSEGVSPIEELSVSSGTHSVTVYLDGYDPQKEKVEIESSETEDLSYILTPITKQSSETTSTQEEKTESKTTSTFTSQESSDSNMSKTTMQLSESKQEELIKIAEQYYGAKNVEVAFISNDNGMVVVTYSIDSVPSKKTLSDDISGILIAANSVAKESGIPNANANVVILTIDGTPLGTGTYYPLRETGKMDIDVS